MTMMGSSGSGGEFGNFYDLIGLLKDDKLYEPKIRELDNRIKNAQATLAQATDLNQQAIDNRRLANDILESANAKLIEANLLKREQVELAQRTAEREAALAKQQGDHAKAVAAYEAQIAQDALAYDVTTRALQAREQAVQQAEAQAVASRHQADEDIEAAVLKSNEVQRNLLAQAHGKLAEADIHRKEAAKLTAALAQRKTEYEEFFARMKAI